MATDVAILDYQINNLHSVQAACAKVGLSSIVTHDPGEVAEAKALILPGVGAFGEAMNNLRSTGLDDCIKRFVGTGKPLFGICLGLQLLFERSEEFGEHLGLGLIEGSVTKFRFYCAGNTRYPVPQVGWNRVHKENRSWHDSFMSRNQSGDFMYFVHSYFVQPVRTSIIVSLTTYGDQPYCSAIKENNIFATQFHPEKSGPAGIKIYEQLRNSLKDE